MKNNRTQTTGKCLAHPVLRVARVMREGKMLDFINPTVFARGIKELQTKPDHSISQKKWCDRVFYFYFMNSSGGKNLTNTRRQERGIRNEIPDY